MSGCRRLSTLLILAILVRVLCLGWDSGLVSPHPDERRVAMVADEMSGSLDDPEFFAYGTLHLNLVRAATAVAGLPDGYAGLIRGGRLLSVAASVLALMVGAWMAWRAWGRPASEGLLALALVVPLDVQQSHFATVESLHALLVVAALAGSWRAALGSLVGAVTAGAAFGASLGVKVSSLPLVIPLAVAGVVCWRRLGARSAVTAGAAAAAASLAAVSAAQPWTFAGGRPPLVGVILAAAGAAALMAADRWGRWRWPLTGVGALAWLGVGWNLLGVSLNPSCVRDVAAQLAMVTGRADVAYVRVYDPTLPLLYSLRELALWALGPALVVGVLVGSVAGARVVWRRREQLLTGSGDGGSVLVLLVLAWVAPVGLRLATLDVKFLRYWQPLVVPLLMLVAWWLLRLRAGRRRTVTVVVVGFTVVWGGAYLLGLADRHPHRRATDWLDERLTPGQTVAFEHWDETLPLPASVGRVTLPSYDLPDDGAKALRWCRALAEADWAVLTSNRVRRTVLANRERFPRTSALYELLLAGEAGFRPTTTFSRGPRVLGATLPVQLADESFVNYEMPRVVVLRRVDVIDPERLAAQAAQAASEGGRSFPELERVVDGYPSAPPAATAVRQVVDTALWVLVWAVLGGSAWVLLLPVTRRLPDGGLGLALVTGWIGLAWLLWCGNRLRLWPAGGGTATVLLLGLVAAAAVTAPRRWPALRALADDKRPLLVAGVTGGVFLLFLVIRLGNPAVWWGEKPMDLTFLSAFAHARQWPPGEPWLAGRPLHYYYFGEVLGAVPIKLTRTNVAVGYNLIAATIPALAAAVASSLGLLVRRRRIVAALAAPGVVLLSGNLLWPWLLGQLREGRLFDAWWATSRVIPGFAIDEFPLWTALFADLHAHLFAVPVMLAALGWVWLVVGDGARSGRAAIVLCGATAGVLLMTNPWDLPVLCTTATVVALAVGPRPWIASLRLLAVGGVGLAVAAPFLVELGAWLRAGVAGGGVHWNAEEFAPAVSVLQHFGQFMVPLVIGAGWVCRHRWRSTSAVVAVGALVGWALGSPAAVVALGAAGALFSAARAASDRRARLPWVLAGWSLVLVAACERVTLVDRMNTLFKVYNGVWLLLGLALVAVLVGARGRLGRVVVCSWLPLGVAAAMNLPLGIAQGWLQPRVTSPRPTLDGRAFLERHDPSTAWLVETLAACAAPGDTVAEAAGPPYREYTRISMHTGLPTVVGWEWHLRQRGQRSADIAARKSDLETLYSDRSPGRRRAVLDRWGVRWVVVGDVERSTYGIVGRDPLSEVPGVVRLASHGSDVVYLARRSTIPR